MKGRGEILAPCGIDCAKCPAYLATQEDDREKLRKMAQVWATDDSHYDPEDLVCDGCRGKRISRDCRVCWMRSCAQKRRLENCAHCTNYPCPKLEHEWRTWKILSGADAKARLDAIRQKLPKAI